MNITAKQLEFALKIYIQGINKEKKAITRAEFLRKADIVVSDNNIRTFFKSLWQEGIVIMTNDSAIGNHKFYINPKKMIDLIESTELYKLFKKYEIYNIP